LRLVEYLMIMIKFQVRGDWHGSGEAMS
jgi:hypothetical protein